MKSFMEGELEFERGYDNDTLLFLLHFMPPPKLDNSFVDQCIESVLERLHLDDGTKESSSAHFLESQSPKDKNHAA